MDKYGGACVRASSSWRGWDWCACALTDRGAGDAPPPLGPAVCRGLHVCDLSRPFVPLYTLDGQDEGTASLLWKDKDTIWSCTKKESFFPQRISDGRCCRSRTRTPTRPADASGPVAGEAAKGPRRLPAFDARNMLW